MEIKAMVVIQLLLDLVFVVMVLWFVWRKEERARRPIGGFDKQAVLARDIQRWETASHDLIGRMQAQVKTLKTLVADLDRAEICASETLQKMERFSGATSADPDRYDQATGWLKMGTPIEEVSERTGLGIDEVRLMREFATGHHNQT